MDNLKFLSFHQFIYHKLSRKELCSFDMLFCSLLVILYPVESLPALFLQEVERAWHTMPPRKDPTA